MKVGAVRAAAPPATAAAGGDAEPPRDEQQPRDSPAATEDREMELVDLEDPSAAEEAADQMPSPRAGARPRLRAARALFGRAMGVSTRIVAFNAFMGAVEDDTKQFVAATHMDPLRLTFADATVEARYNLWRLERVLPYVRTGLVALGVLNAAFVVYDLAEAAPNRGAMLACRGGIMVAMAVYTRLLLLTTRFRGAAVRVTAGAALAATLAEVALVFFEVTGPYEFALLIVYVFTWIGLPFYAATPLVALGLLLWLPAAAAGGLSVDTAVFYGVLFGSQAFAAYRSEAMLRGDFVHETQLEAAREKSRSLLLSVFPNPIVKRLTSGDRTHSGIVADRIDVCTVLFTDIERFTDMCARLDAVAVTGIVHRMFSRFDQLAAKHGVYKIETIGDAWMGCCGAPVLDPDHAARMLAMAVDMIASLERDPIAVPGLPPVRIRVGMHSGSVHAGVVGQTMPRYTLIGDTVNTASRMESNSRPMCAAMSGATHALLRDAVAGLERTALAPEQRAAVEEAFARVRPRGQIAVKGKGQMDIYDYVPSFVAAQSPMSSPTSSVDGGPAAVLRAR